MYTLLDQPRGAEAEGPAVIEGPFFTMRLPDGWLFETTAAGDLPADRPEEQLMRVPMTEYLEIDLERERWLCRRMRSRSRTRAAATTRRARSSMTVTRARSTAR